MLLAHAVLLAEARSYLAALTDHALTFDGSMEYERVLLALDELHGGVVPPTTGVPVADPRDLPTSRRPPRGPQRLLVGMDALSGCRGDHCQPWRRQSTWATPTTPMAPTPLTQV